MASSLWLKSTEYQISQDLGFSQQLVSSHLKMMEKANLVQSEFIQGSNGPKRRIYSLHRSLLLTFELAPFLFRTRILSFSERPRKTRRSKESSQFLELLDSVTELEIDKEKIGSYTDLLQVIDKKLDQLENERAALLYARNRVVQDASDVVMKIDNLDSRRVLYYIINNPDYDIDNLSRRLNLREETIRHALDTLKENNIIPRKM